MEALRVVGLSGPKAGVVLAGGVVGGVAFYFTDTVIVEVTKRKWLVGLVGVAAGMGVGYLVAGKV